MVTDEVDEWMELLDEHLLDERPDLPLRNEMDELEGLGYNGWARGHE